MKNRIKNNKGFSYIEILMAAAILSIAVIPIIAGFYNAIQSIVYAERHYKAGLYAANLFVEAQKNLEEPSAYFQGAGSWDLAGIIDNPVFNEEYEIELFDYRLSVFNLSDSSVSFSVSTEADLPPVVCPEFSGVTISGYPQITENDFIVHDGEFLEISPSSSRVNIYADTFPTPAAIEVSASIPSVVAYMPRAKSYEILVMTEVFDKEHAPLHKLVSTLAAREVIP